MKPPRETHSKARILLVMFEVTMICGILLFWHNAASIQNSKSLIVLFFYSFPSEFIIGLLPHEPLLLYYGEYYVPVTVAVVAVIGTVLAEAMNYSVFSVVLDINYFYGVVRNKSVSRIIGLFNRAPFLALLIAGFTPVPFFPFRLMVVMSHYPRYKYLTAVFLSRAPRFYLLALVGYTFDIPDYVLWILFLILMISTGASLVRLRKLKTMHREE